MPEDLRPLGYDPDWYDKGPGSESFKRKLAREMAEHDAERFKHRARDAAIVRAAEALADHASKLTPEPRKAEDVDLDRLKEFGRLLTELYKAVRGEAT